MLDFVVLLDFWFWGKFMLFIDVLNCFCIIGVGCFIILGCFINFWFFISFWFFIIFWFFIKLWLFIILGCLGIMFEFDIVCGFMGWFVILFIELNEELFIGKDVFCDWLLFIWFRDIFGCEVLGRSELNVDKLNDCLLFVFDVGLDFEEFCIWFIDLIFE